MSDVETDERPVGGEREDEKGAVPALPSLPRLVRRVGGGRRRTAK